MSQLSFKRKIYFSFFYKLRRRLWAHLFLTERLRAEQSFPQTTLQEKNISNLKTLTNRESLLQKLPNDKIVAEIGVDQGDFSELILKYNHPQKLHLIDAWGDENRYHDGLKGKVYNKFKMQIDEGKVELNLGFSTAVLQEFADHYFDWVYLDTDHSYQTTKTELEILQSKMKKGGIIAGHDYTIGNWVNSYRYGVIEAVNEFCVVQNWEIIFLTTEADHHRSFAIREIG